MHESTYSYRTIELASGGLYREKGSKFLAFAYPVNDEDEIKERIAFLKKEYYDARHHCFAWVLGADGAKFRANDDGEPNHSAGDPILGQIRSKNLTNILVVVVRYFGGVKLGIGGLVAAYKSATKDALDNASIVDREVCHSFLIVYSYDSTSEVLKLVNEFNVNVIRQEFGALCNLEGQVGERFKEKFIKKVKLLNALKFDLTIQWR